MTTALATVFYAVMVPATFFVLGVGFERDRGERRAEQSYYNEGERNE